MKLLLQRKVSSTKLFAPALLALSSLFMVAPVNAGIPVFDGSNFANMINSAVNQAQQITQFTTQISQYAQQINQMAHGNVLSSQMLSQLGLGGFAELSNQISTQVSNIQKLQGAVTTITHDVSSVQSQFNDLYKTGASSFTNMSPSQMMATMGNWSNALQQANKAALQSQTVVNNIQGYNDKLSNILSTAADGSTASQVAQIQSTNQMLGVIGQQLNDLNQQTSDSNRAVIQAMQTQSSYYDAVMSPRQVAAGGGATDAQKQVYGLK